MLWFFEGICISISCYKIFKTKPWEKTISNLKAIVAILAIAFIVLIPANNLLLIGLSDPQDKIILEGKVISVSGPSGRNKSYGITFEFADGSKKSWNVPQYSYHWENGKLIENHKIVQNYRKYEKVYVIGYKSVLGIRLVSLFIE